MKTVTFRHVEEGDVGAGTVNVDRELKFSPGAIGRIHKLIMVGRKKDDHGNLILGDSGVTKTFQIEIKYKHYNFTETFNFENEKDMEKAYNSISKQIEDSEFSLN